MEYAKLMDGSIFFAPQVIVHDTQRIYNPPAELLTLHGFKPVRFTEPPEIEPGYEAVSGWEETQEAILQIWTVQPEGELSDGEVLNILLGGESV